MQSFTVSTDHRIYFTHFAPKPSHFDVPFLETLRKYPPIAHLPRITTRPYTCAETNITIPKNVAVIVPVYGIHHDPCIYPNPELFRPERFLTDELKEQSSVTFLPFGAGPRNCIAFRMGMVQLRCSLAMLLNHFTFGTCDQTVPMPIKFHPSKLALISERPIILTVRKN